MKPTKLWSKRRWPIWRKKHFHSTWINWMQPQNRTTAIWHLDEYVPLTQLDELFFCRKSISTIVFFSLTVDLGWYLLTWHLECLQLPAWPWFHSKSSKLETRTYKCRKRSVNQSMDWEAAKNRSLNIQLQILNISILKLHRIKISN